MSPPSWYHGALIAGGFVCVGALFWYLMHEDNSQRNNDKKRKQGDVNEASASRGDTLTEPNGQPSTWDSKAVTEDKVKEILHEILESQTLMRNILKTLAKDIKATSPSFDDIYQLVKTVQPEDPLEKRGITMVEFDLMLERFHHSSEIRELLTQIMCASPGTEITAEVGNIPTSKVIEVHEFMLSEVKKAIKVFQAAQESNCDKNYDMKTVTIAVQAIVGSETEKKFNLSSEEIEGAVLLHHQTLCVDPKFSRINLEMQSVMSGLMGLQQQGPGLGMDSPVELSSNNPSPADLLLLQQQHQQMSAATTTLAKS